MNYMLLYIIFIVSYIGVFAIIDRLRSEKTHDLYNLKRRVLHLSEKYFFTGISLISLIMGVYFFAKIININIVEVPRYYYTIRSLNLITCAISILSLIMSLLKNHKLNIFLYGSSVILIGMSIIVFAFFETIIQSNIFG